MYQIIFLLYVLYVAHAQPFLFSKVHHLEMTHLIILMIHSNLMTVYTELVLNPRTRYEMGFVSICMLLAQLLLSTALIAASGLISVRRKVALRLYQKKLKT